uniref:Uncharacterized protein n=1 Tax=Daphnia galeata TaxID=27404 RepID=A0A8J2WK75_9CRUS|nr:unnamed protein product [Daphnia galeata]
MEKLPSFVLLLVLLVPFCSAQNDEFRVNNNKELIYPRNVEATWKRFMVRMLKNIRSSREAARRELILSQAPYPVTVDPLGEDLGDSNNVNKVVSSVSCSQFHYCSTSTSITDTDQQSSVSTGTTNNSSNNSNSNNSNSSTSTSGGGTATSSNNSSSSSSSSSG